MQLSFAVVAAGRLQCWGRGGRSMTVRGVPMHSSHNDSILIQARAEWTQGIG